MKLRNKIILTFLKAILIPVLLVSGLSQYSFNRSFNEYLRFEQRMRFNTLKEGLSKLIVVVGENDLLLGNLEWYAHQESVNIQVFDKTGELKYNYIGIGSRDLNKGKYVTSTIDITRDDQVIGKVKLSYMDNNYLDPRAHEFKNSLIRNFILSGLVALVAGLAVSLYLSRHLAIPMVELAEQTRELREGHYPELSPKSDIEEIQNLSTHINYLSKNLKLQENVRKSYAQDISHELRTPLTNLQLHLEAMRDGIIDDSEENLDRLIEEIHRLNKLVDQLKNTFHQDASDLDVKLQNIDVTGEVESILHTLGPTFTINNIEICSALDPKIHLRLDRDKFFQVLYNLLSNAVKALQKRDRDARITVSLTGLRDRVILSVEDNGIGISRQDIPKIFNRFYRVDAARNSEDGGHGLGLAIAKSYTEVMGGTISVESHLSQGSRFILEFPRDKYPQPKEEL